MIPAWLPFAALALWGAFPCGLMLGFCAVYGYRAECETTWWLGPGAPLGVSFNATRFYWCPLGFVGLEVEMIA